MIVNRPTDVPLSRVFPDIERIAKLPDKLFFGGPVATDVLTFIFRAPAAPENAIEVLAGVYMSSSRPLLRELLGREKPMEDLRVFAGVASWAPGQLEREISRGDWRLARTDAGAIFERRPEGLWPELDRRASATKTGL